ncbi:MAG TPA: HpaII family restriction endonuclease [Defluviitaleaceae bacterium]|nr:HpaII family restriction endonuclease [Defluviitaleaceae bacterium]
MTSNMTGNKGEWSEVYVFLKLLADGKLYAADAALNKIPKIYYQIIKILRDNWEYLRNGEIKVVDQLGNVHLKIPISDFVSYAELLLSKIRESKGAFAVPEVEQFLQQIKITKIKSSPRVKPDIILVVHDLITGLEPTLRFSIKSRLGEASTLLNASGSTNFIYKVVGTTLNEAEINNINNINDRNDKIRKRIEAIIDKGGQLEFVDTENEIFKLNMQVIDSNLPLIISRIVLNYYKGKATDLKDLLQIVEQENPCGFKLNYNHSFYSYKVKKFLTDIALGMKPSDVWNGYYDANGGYIIVREDGDIVCYHIYNKNEFEDYLLNNTKLDTPSSTRHGFGTLYKDTNNNLLIKLNLQIRFKY